MWERVRNYFFAGLLVTAPIGLTLYIAWVIVDFIDRSITALIPGLYTESALPFHVPGLGLVLLLVGLTLIGFITTNIFGRLMLQSGEAILARMPVVRSIYGATKQIAEMLFGSQKSAFRQVVLIEYPRRECWTLGFISGPPISSYTKAAGQELINVFVPTTPNPTSGYLLAFPADQIRPLNMSVEEGFKFIISGGIVTPDMRE
ncbi:MAG: DUF502 domain-containing protein [Dongiaceae bacterium]